MENNNSESVGVLLVHGIGEQRRFQHLESEVRQIATALDADPSIDTVKITVNTLPNAAFAAEQQTWRADDLPPVSVEVTDKAGTVTDIDFREVWWADLDEPSGFLYRVRFWNWILSMWATRGYLSSKQPGYDKWMKPVAEKSRVRFWDRFWLFVISITLFMPVVLITFAELVLRQVLKIRLGVGKLFVQYVGDVKLYQQNKRMGKGPLEDLGQRPRVSIRRRMIRSLVQMALADYDRWYVLGHSLGAVVSFNGLMDPELRLPNYLSEDLWKRCEKKLAGTADEALTDEMIHSMIPRRSSKRAKNDTIDRRKLFKNLKGYMTYGAPLEKFTVLWPAIVPLNSDLKAFNNEFQWINIIDSSDPVAGEITRFELKPYGPVNIRYRGPSLHMPSHTKYLTFQEKRADNLVNHVAKWFLNGGKFTAPKAGSSNKWPGAGRVAVQAFVRWFIWVFFGVVFAALVGQFMVIPALAERAPNLEGAVFVTRWATTIGLGLVPGTVLALLAGIVRRVF